MKRLALLQMIFALAIANLCAAGNAPRGTLLELHSCELYAGGCVVSSQATLDGRYMLRAWNFTGGQYGGQELRGLRLAILQSGSQNLAAQDTIAEQAVIYLPNEATAAQRAALLSWANSTLGLKLNGIKTRVVPLQFARTNKGYSFSAGDFAAFRTTSLESCQTGACGEALWYNPRSATSLFTVAVDSSSRVIEPFLHLKWTDAGQRSVFLGRFGDESRAQNQFVTLADFCSSADKLF